MLKDFKSRADVEINKLGMYFEGLAFKISTFVDNDFTLDGTTSIDDFLVCTSLGNFKASAIEKAYASIDTADDPDAITVPTFASEEQYVEQVSLNNVINELSLLENEAVGLGKVFSNYQSTDSATDVLNALKSVLTDDQIVNSNYLSTLSSLKLDQSVPSAILGLLQSMSSDSELSDTKAISVKGYTGSGLMASIAASSLGAMLSQAFPVVASVIGSCFGVIGSIVGYAISALIELIPNLIRAAKGQGPVVKYNSGFNFDAFNIPLFSGKCYKSGMCHLKVSDAAGSKIFNIPEKWFSEFIGDAITIKTGNLVFRLQTNPNNTDEYNYSVYGAPIYYDGRSQNGGSTNTFYAPLLGMDVMQYFASTSVGSTINSAALCDYLRGANLSEGKEYNTSDTKVEWNISFGTSQIVYTTSGNAMHYDMTKDFAEIGDDDYANGTRAFISIINGVAITLTDLQEMWLNLQTADYSGIKYSFNDSVITLSEYNMSTCSFALFPTILPDSMNSSGKGIPSANSFNDWSVDTISDRYTWGFPRDINKLNNPFLSSSFISNPLSIFSNPEANYENMEINSFWKYIYGKISSSNDLVSNYDELYKTVNIPDCGLLVNDLFALLYINFMYAYGDPYHSIDEVESAYFNDHFNMLPIGVYRGPCGDKFSVTTVSDLERNLRLLGKITVGFVSIAAIVGSIAFIKLRKNMTMKRSLIEADRWSLYGQVNDGSIDRATFAKSMKKLNFKDKIFALLGGKMPGAVSTGLAAAGGSILGNTFSKVEEVMAKVNDDSGTLLRVGKSINPNFN